MEAEILQQGNRLQEVIRSRKERVQLLESAVQRAKEDQRITRISRIKVENKVKDFNLVNVDADDLVLGLEIILARQKQRLEEVENEFRKL